MTRRMVALRIPDDAEFQMLMHPDDRVVGIQDQVGEAQMWVLELVQTHSADLTVRTFRQVPSNEPIPADGWRYVGTHQGMMRHVFERVLPPGVLLGPPFRPGVMDIRIDMTAAGEVQQSSGMAMIVLPLRIAGSDAEGFSIAIRHWPIDMRPDERRLRMVAHTVLTLLAESGATYYEEAR